MTAVQELSGSWEPHGDGRTIAATVPGWYDVTALLAGEQSRDRALRARVLKGVGGADRASHPVAQDGSRKSWFVLPLQVHSCNGVASAVASARTSRHLPDPACTMSRPAAL